MTKMPPEYQVEWRAKRKAKRNLIGKATERIATEFNGDITEVSKELEYLRNKVKERDERIESLLARVDSYAASNATLTKARSWWKYKHDNKVTSERFGTLTESEYLAAASVIEQMRNSDNVPAFLNRLKYAIGANPLEGAKQPLEYVPEVMPYYLTPAVKRPVSKGKKSVKPKKG